MKFIVATLAAAMLAGFGFRAEADPKLVNGIDAVVHDSIITFQEVDLASGNVMDKLREQYVDQPNTLSNKLAEVYKETLEDHIERKLILHEFETAGYNLPESIIDEQLDNYIKSKYANRVTLTKTLQQEGISFEKFRQDFKENFIVEQMRYKNISSALIISPHKVETYYIEHQNDFKEEDKVKLRMIVLTNAPDGDTAKTRALAQEILDSLNRGSSSFEEVATLYSQGSQQHKGGDWGWVEKSQLRPELADVAFNLKPGEKSGIIETPIAFFIMLVEDKTTSHVKPLSETRDDIEKILLAKEHARLQQQWIEGLKKKTFIREFPY